MSEYINDISLVYTYSHLVILQGQFFICSIQFSYFFFFNNEMSNAEYNMFSMNVLWVCLLTKDSTERPQKQAVEICDSRHRH